MRARIILSMLLCGTVTAVFGQSIGTWNNYTSMRDVRGVAVDGTGAWGATSGGIFHVNTGGVEYRRWTYAEGMQSINTTAITVDPAMVVWTGGADGSLHMLGSSGVPQAILDIANSTFTAKRINHLTVVGDTILISTDFGLVLFRRGRHEFGDTYTRFGSISSGQRVSARDAVVAGGRLWIALVADTAAHIHPIASAPLNGSNLLSPDAWTLEQAGPATAIPNDIAVLHDTVFVATSQGLFKRTGGGWVPVTDFAGKNLLSLATNATALCAVAQTGDVFRMAANGTVSTVGAGLTAPPTSVTFDSQGNPVLGTSGAGIALLAAGAWVPHIPDGPAANFFSNVSVTPNGVLWGASSPSAGAGLYRFDGAAWTTFTTANSVLPSNYFYRTSVTCNGSLWASSWGGGMVEFPEGGSVLDRDHVYNTNVGIVGITVDPNFVVASNVVCDENGNTWAAIDAGDKNILAVKRANGTWAHLPVIYGGVKLGLLSEDAVDKALAIDGQNNLWASVRAPFGGVICLQNAGRIDSVAEVLITSANGLPSDDIKTVIVDRDNTIWVGTSLGIGIILDPSHPLSKGAISSYKPLLGNTINTIAVDPLNQKWVGTPEGVIVLSPDGTQTVASYTVKSTAQKLIDDNIKSIAISPKTGVAWFATPSGLASLKTASVAPAESPGTLTAYPNPFRVPSTQMLTIDGLTANSEVKVLGIDGRLIRTLTTPGGRVGFWDGNDERGHTVASGIYLLVGYDADGNVVTGKVAVIRH